MSTRLISDHAFCNPPYLVVRSSPINRQGLFTTKTCRAGDVLMVITGELLDTKEARRRETEEGNFYIYRHDDDLYLDPPLGSKARFPNHSCQPNAITGYRTEMTRNLSALRDIACGEEITFDYKYDDIYELCREANPLCLHSKCPVIGAQDTAMFTDNCSD
jgi:SET domain-containing protein